MVKLSVAAQKPEGKQLGYAGRTMTCGAASSIRTSTSLVKVLGWTHCGGGVKVVVRAGVNVYRVRDVEAMVSKKEE